MIDHLSYSSVNTYLLCPRSWKFRYLDKLAAPTSPALIFGSAFHNAVENYLARETSTPLVAIWAESWKEQLESERNQNIFWGDDNADDMFALGERMLRTKAITETIDAIKPLIQDGEPVIEKFIELGVPGVPVPIIGYIDVITQDGVPCDLKTASKKWYASKAESEAQPVFYLAALNQLGYDLNPEMKFRYYIFTKTKSPAVQVIETKRTIGELMALFGTVVNVWRGIENNVFPCNTNTWKCSAKWCEYWDGCQGSLR